MGKDYEEEQNTEKKIVLEIDTKVEKEKKSKVERWNYLMMGH